MTLSSSPFKAVLSLAFLASLAACSSGGGGGGGPAPKLDPGAVVKPDSDGKFETTKIGELLEFGLPPEEFKITRAQCQGISVQQKGKYGFDKNLKVGQRFKETILTATASSVFGMVESLTLTQLSGNDGVFAIEVSQPDSMPTNTKLPALKGTATCSMDEQAGTSKCESKYDDGFIPPTTTDVTYCIGHVVDPSANKGTVALGTYTMASGAKVSARRIEKTSKVHVVCSTGAGSEQDMGEGTEINVSIESVDVVYHRYLSCYRDGTPLYTYSTIVLADGKTMSTTKTELLEAPLAK